MTGKRLLLTIGLLLAISTSALAQPPIVNIQLHPGEPRTIGTTPRAFVVCRTTPGCPTEYNFRWTGPEGAADERLQVEFLDGLFWNEADQPAANAATACFSFPEGKNPFELEYGPENGRNVIFKEAAADCEDKVFFFYEIRCTGGAGGNCGGVEPLDPGGMVDNGGRP